ncbi:SPOSA6832_00722 [Sporobolomyces salmonicolor]|uniref:Actin-related protein 2/3 complex subunit 3 n=1 Tax=Sporidiobolus salmonicolor TaxID=5005 RepID=A0A0D6EGT6_SPOSA|nr:SPOSA6832_00722 [Sporobolomyces salmonicolor]
MPAYHSSYNDPADLAECRLVGNLALLPFSSKLRGPAPQPALPELYAAHRRPHTDSLWSTSLADLERPDIIAETLSLFRPNSLFRNFEIKGPADRILIYLILFTGDCLGKVGQARTWTAADALKHLTTHALDHFSLPGEPGFPLNSVFTGAGAGDRLYDPLDTSTEGGRKASKWWMSFQRRRFMGKSLGA